MDETKLSANWRLQTIKLNSLHGKKGSRANAKFCSPVALGKREMSTRLDRESVQALEEKSSPDCEGNDCIVTATQKRDPKQIQATEKAMKFCANHRGRDNLKLQPQASALACGLPKH